jgi:hypothetical protein
MEVLTCRSEWDEADWVDVDEFIGCLFESAVERGLSLLLQTEERDLNLRLEQRGELAFVSSDRPITAHEVWRRSIQHGKLHVLQGPASETVFATAGQLAMIAMGSSGFHPLQVYPSFWSRGMTAVVGSRH